MAKRKTKMDRFHGRSHRLTGKLPGKLFDPTEQEYITARASDVSAGGLGIVSDVPLSRGQILWLILDDSYIKLEVINCKGDSKGRYRVGLIQKNPVFNLETIFADYSCLSYSYED